MVLTPDPGSATFEVSYDFPQFNCFQAFRVDLIIFILAYVSATVHGPFAPTVSSPICSSKWVFAKRCYSVRRGIVGDAACFRAGVIGFKPETYELFTNTYLSSMFAASLISLSRFNRCW